MKWQLSLGRNIFLLFLALAGIALYIASPQVGAQIADLLYSLAF